VRNLQARLVDHVLPVEEEVEVECARALGRNRRPVPPERALQLQQPAEQTAGGEAGLELDDAVEETGLIDVADRIRLPERRDAQHVRLGRVAEAPDGGAKRSLTIAEVGPEADVRVHHGHQGSARLL
jgi:hypothetical protein